MRPYKIIDLDAPEWTGPFLRPCFVCEGTSGCNEPADDLTRAALSGGGGWLYSLKGGFVVKEADRNTWVGAGHGFLFSNPTHVTLMYPEPVTRIRVGFYGEESADIIEQMIYRYGSFHKIPAASKVVKKTRDLFRLAQRNPLRTAHFWSMHSYEWLIHLARALEKKGAVAERKHMVTRNSRLIGVVHPSFKSYADAVGYDPSYLARAIKKSWGKSPARVLRRERLKHAEILLLTTNLSVREISEKVCYSSPESFATTFRSTYGLPPLKYRHQSRMGWKR